MWHNLARWLNVSCNAAIVAIALAGPGQLLAQGVIADSETQLEVEIHQDGGRFTACGIRMMTAAVTAVPNVRVWDVSMSIYLDAKRGSAMVKAMSYDTPQPHAAPKARAAPTAIGFSVRGRPGVIETGGIKPALVGDGAILGVISDSKAAVDVLRALLARTPVLLFFTAKGNETEVISIAAMLEPGDNAAFGECLEGLISP
jgi:hypothetical protein